MKQQRNIRVLVVDDSAVFRMILERELNAREGIEVVGTAADPYSAREQIVRLNPDVLTLDLVMPRMGGLAFLEKLMAAQPMPVIVVSAFGEPDSPSMLEALSLGAVDVIKKPGYTEPARSVCNQLAELIRHAVNLDAPGRRPPIRSAPPPGNHQLDTRKMMAIGASTGGVQAIEHILLNLPASTPGIVVAQHMPAHFTPLFAQRLDTLCSMNVKEAAHGDRIRPGQVLIAPGGRHMIVERSGAEYEVRLNHAPPVWSQRPSVDVLFHSVAQQVGSRAVGALLTGMGYDGAEGLLAMKKAGAHTLAQDETSCIVFGMPKEAIKIGGADQVIPLDKMAETLLACSCRRPVAMGATP